MTNAPDDNERRTKGARDELSRLNGQVAAMRAVLTQLLQDVVRAEMLLEHSQGMQLLEANEQLVVSALAAQTDAEKAVGALNEASRTGGPDQLTGLPNRALFLDRLESAMSHAKRHGTRVALLFLDLNGFKQINDSFGHHAGDQALQLVADCLKSLVRETDTVSRHGGDEFLILLAEVTHASDAATVAEKVNAALGGYSQIDEHAVHLTASIGISVYPDDGVDAETLIDRADAAMYLAKRLERGSFVFHADKSLVHASGPAPPVRRVNHHELEMAEHEQRHEQLREVNEQLVLAALGAEELLGAAEETRRRQATLLALVANELSNPLAPIRLAAAALGQPDAEKTLLPRVQALIDEQVDKMSRLVGELLDSRQVGKTRLPLGPQPFGVAEPIGVAPDIAIDVAIDVAIEACRPAMDKRQQTLEVTISRLQEMNADPALLTQVLMNLLANASLYTDDGGLIRLGVKVVDGRLRLSVVDSGQAIFQDAASAVFDPFVIDPRASLVGGNGIGSRLTGLREIVEMHGGTVAATSVDGTRGNQFTVSLPMDSRSLQGWERSRHRNHV